MEIKVLVSTDMATLLFGKHKIVLGTENCGSP